MSEDFGFDSIFDEGVVSEEEDQKDQEVAVPDEEVEDTEGSKDQEVAAPEEGQSSDENAKYAAARRKAERERDLAIQRERENTASVIKAMGIVDPYTGEPVEDLDGLKRYSDSVAKEQQKESEEMLEDAGLSKEQIDALVASHPVVRQAQSDAARLSELEAVESRARMERILDEEIKKIQEFDPRIKSFDDLDQSPSREAMIEMTNNGYSLSDAYFIANRDEIVQRQVDAGKQEARNDAASKGHLDKSASRGSGGVTVPSDEMEQFRMLMPNKSDADIQNFYARDKKRMEKG